MDLVGAEVSSGTSCASGVVRGVMQMAGSVEDERAA
jgi:hypothetical protein